MGSLHERLPPHLLLHTSFKKKKITFFKKKTRTLARSFLLFLFLISHRLKELELEFTNRVPQRKAQNQMASLVNSTKYLGKN